MERVMTILANQFSIYPELKITLLLMSRQEHSYDLPDTIAIIEPNFYHKNFSRLVFTLKIFIFVRRSLKRIQPDTILTFGGKYNSFVLLSVLGVSLRIFISDRSRPGISYGKFLDILNPWVYKLAKGIIAQTEKAQEVVYKSVKHTNIKVIANPIKASVGKTNQRENIILNVGRFIKSKHQDWLINYFVDLNLADWRLVFLGEGSQYLNVKNR